MVEVAGCVTAVCHVRGIFHFHVPEGETAPPSWSIIKVRCDACKAAVGAITIEELDPGTEGFVWAVMARHAPVH